jgi:hypothetical protein
MFICKNYRLLSQVANSLKFQSSHYSIRTNGNGGNVSSSMGGGNQMWKNHRSINADLKPFGGQIQYMSDLHLDHKQWDPNGEPPVLNPVAPYLVIAGDLGNIDTPIFRRFIRNVNTDFDQVILVPGNHEFYGFEYHRAMKIMKSMELDYPRLHVLLGSYTYQDSYLPSRDRRGDSGSSGGSGVVFDRSGGSNSLVEKYDSYVENTVLLPLKDGYSVRVAGAPLWSEIPDDVEIHEMCNQKVKDYQKIQYWNHNLMEYSRPLSIDDTNYFHHCDVDWLLQVFWNKLVTEFDSNHTMVANGGMGANGGMVANGGMGGINNDKCKSLVVTHHSPLVEECCHPKFLFRYDPQSPDQPILDRTRWCNWAFSTRLNWLIHEMQPTAWIFGHTHYRTVFEYKWTCEMSGMDQSTVIASNPVTNDGTGVRRSYETIDPMFIKVL